MGTVFSDRPSFKDIRNEFRFVHVRSAAYDHEQSALIDRECRTLLEAVSTFLEQSGAPPSFWGEAARHFTHTKNNTPTHKRTITEEGKEKDIFLSPEEVLTNRRNPFSFRHFQAFGTQTHAFIPQGAREGRKTPGQKKHIEGVIIGYAEDSRAYRVWDIEARKAREISFYFCVISEGFFPLKEKKHLPFEREEAPTSFFPTFESFLKPEEWKKYGFTEEEEKELLKKKGAVVYPEEKELHPHHTDLDEKHTEEKDKRDRVWGGGGETTAAERKEKESEMERRERREKEDETLRVVIDRRQKAAVDFWRQAIADGIEVTQPPAPGSVTHSHTHTPPLSLQELHTHS